MTASALKKKIHQYLNNTDDKILKAVYTILEEHAKVKQDVSSLTPNQKAELDRRMILYEAGKMEVHTWSEVYKELKNKKRK